VALPHFVKDHLYNTFILPDKKIIISQIGKAECQLSAKSRIDKTCTQKHTPPPNRRSAAECSGKIPGEFDPFKGRDEPTGSPWQEDVPGRTKIVRRWLLALTTVRGYDKVSRRTLTVEAADNLRCG
jgi:hypothetical protein